MILKIVLFYFLVSLGKIAATKTPKKRGKMVNFSFFFISKIAIDYDVFCSQDEKLKILPAVKNCNVQKS